MRVLLLNPPLIDGKRFIREGRCTQEEGAWATLWPPISLAYIGAVLEQAGHNILILDSPTEVDLKAKVSSFLPQIAIWSSATPTIESDLALSDFFKNHNLYTATFGTHVSALTQDCMEKYANLDFVIRGEPEYTVRDLVEAIEQNKELGAVFGLSYRDGTGIIKHNSDREFISNLDELPFPAWHLLDNLNYFLPVKGQRFVMVLPTRGCPYGCSFCTSRTYYGQFLRKRSIASVLNEIIYIKDTFKIRDFFFWAETFTLDGEYVKGLCRALIDSKINI